MLDFLQGPSVHAFALYAAAAGLAAVLGLVRDARSRTVPPARLEGMLVPLGLAALAAACAVGAPERIRLLAGALLLTGILLVSLAPRASDRRSAGRQIGLLCSWASVAVALASAFIRHSTSPNLPT